MNTSFPSDLDPQLLVRFLSGGASQIERQQVQDWMAISTDNRQYIEQLQAVWQSSTAAADFAGIDATNDWKKVKSRMNPAWQQALQPVRPARIRWMYPLLRAAAAAVLVLGIVTGLYHGWSTYLPAEEQLTTVASNQPLLVTLSDGSKVFLNSHARLRYPKSFSGATRAVQLSGEAFFEVRENKEKPFIIATGAAVTQVLGTSFLVNAPKADSVLVSVVSGRVAFFVKGREDGRLMLIKGEQGRYLRGQLSEAPEVDANFLSWHTGILTFRETPLSEVARSLSRYYKRPVLLGSAALASCEFSSRFDQQPLEAVLSEMQLVLPITIQTKGDTLLLNGPGCQ